MPLLFAGAVLLFGIFPSIDLTVSSWFYTPGQGFALGQWAWMKWMYEFAPLLFHGLVVGALAAFVLSLWRRFARLRRPALFLLAVFLAVYVIAGLLLQDHWGRARPGQVLEFGGAQQFTPAWVLADQCEKNCSFVSGHASGAFALMALAWVFRRRRLWLLAGALWGAHIGMIRILQGGHFLSDVIFAGFIVYFCADLLARRVFYRPAAA